MSEGNHFDAVRTLKSKAARAEGLYQAERYRRERVERKLDRARAQLDEANERERNRRAAATAHQEMERSLPQGDELAEVIAGFADSMETITPIPYPRDEVVAILRRAARQLAKRQRSAERAAEHIATLLAELGRDTIEPPRTYPHHRDGLNWSRD